MASFDWTRGLLLVGCVIVSCRSDQSGSSSSDGGSRDASTVSTDGAAGGDVVLKALSLVEAPAPTQRFFWGTLDVTEPGFAVGPQDDLTISLDAENHLRYLSWKQLGSTAKTFGDGPLDFPLTGTRQVDFRSVSDVVDDITVDDASTSSADHFLLRMHVISNAAQMGTLEHLSDYVESTEGTREGAGWSIVYDAQGSLRGATVAAHGSGMVYTGDPDAVARPAGVPSTWSAPVELTAPGFFGPPVDHLTVALDAHGQLRSFSFEKFGRQNMTFGTGSKDFPLSGTASANDLRIVVDDALPPTDSHFVIRYHATGNQDLTDYVEGLDGTRSDDGLVVRYFIKGKLWGADIDAHAAGTLLPMGGADDSDGGTAP